LISSLAIMLTPNLTDPGALWDLLANQSVTDTFLAYSRLISPQVHSLFFFSFFLFFWMFLEKKKWIYGLASGIIFGLLFYTYPFAWMFVGSFFVFLALICVFRKKWLRIRNLVLISLIALLVASPFIFNLVQAMKDPVYPDVSLRYGWVKSHLPQIGITFLVLLIVFLLFFPRKGKKRYDFSLAVVLTPLILLNQQVITGYLLGPARYHHYYYKPFVLIFLLIIVFFQVRKVWKWLVLVILLIGFYNAWLIQATSYALYEPLGIENQKYGAVFRWLNENGNKDEVVLANSYISDLIPIYTSLNTAANLDAHYSLVSDKQLLQRMFLLYRLNGVGADNVKETFYRDREIISKNIYAQKYHKQFGSYEAIPDQELDLFVKDYLDSLTNPIENILKRYQVRYLIWDTGNNSAWNVDQYQFLSLSYQQGGFKIYELRGK